MVSLLHKALPVIPDLCVVPLNTGLEWAEVIMWVSVILNS